MITAYVPRQTVSHDNQVNNDPVEHPSHYTYGRIETIDFIEDKGLNFNRGNAIKYIVRAGHKDNEIEDLEKARWYIDRELQRVKKGQEAV